MKAAPLVRVIVHHGGQSEDWGSIYIEGMPVVGQTFSIEQWERLGLASKSIAFPTNAEEILVRQIDVLDQIDSTAAMKSLRPKLGPALELHVEVRHKA